MEGSLVDRVTSMTLAVEAVAARVRASRLLGRRSLPAVLGALTPRITRDVPRDTAEGAIEASERLLSRLRVVPDTCLYRSLARYAVLRGAGHPARFVMGLDPKKRDIEGHAWVELDGEPVGEIIEPGLTVTFRYPASPS
jgi:hypothetical protein